MAIHFSTFEAPYVRNKESCLLIYLFIYGLQLSVNKSTKAKVGTYG